MVVIVELIVVDLNRLVQHNHVQRKLLELSLSTVIRVERKCGISLSVVGKSVGQSGLFSIIRGTFLSQIRSCQLYSYCLLFQREFSIESLISANPDVIICSDPAGFVTQYDFYHTHSFNVTCCVYSAPYQYSEKEIDSLIEYLEESSGKHILATYASFYHQEGSPSQPHIYDNRRLASLFGFDPTASYTTKKLTAQPIFHATVCSSTIKLSFHCFVMSH